MLIKHKQELTSLFTFLSADDTEYGYHSASSSSAEQQQQQQQQQQHPSHLAAQLNQPKAHAQRQNKGQVRINSTSSFAFCLQVCLHFVAGWDWSPKAPASVQRLPRRWRQKTTTCVHCHALPCRSCRVWQPVISRNISWQRRRRWRHLCRSQSTRIARQRLCWRHPQPTVIQTLKCMPLLFTPHPPCKGDIIMENPWLADWVKLDIIVPQCPLEGLTPVWPLSWRDWPAP